MDLLLTIGLNGQWLEIIFKKIQIIKTGLTEIEIYETSDAKNRSPLHDNFDLTHEERQRKQHKRKDQIIEMVKVILRSHDIDEWDQKIIDTRNQK